MNEDTPQTKPVRRKAARKTAAKRRRFRKTLWVSRRARVRLRARIAGKYRRAMRQETVKSRKRR